MDKLNLTSNTTNLPTIFQGLIPKNYVIYFANMTQDKGYKETPSLNKLQKESPRIAHEYVVELVNDFNSNINIGKKMNKAQIQSAAAMIGVNFKNLRFGELIHFFNNAKKGKYGKLYDSFDVVILMDWLKTYENKEREEYLLSLHLSQKNEGKKIESAVAQVLNKKKANRYISIKHTPHLISKKAIDEMRSGSVMTDSQIEFAAFQYIESYFEMIIDVLQKDEDYSEIVSKNTLLKILTDFARTLAGLRDEPFLETQKKALENFRKKYNYE